MNPALYARLWLALVLLSAGCRNEPGESPPQDAAPSAHRSELVGEKNEESCSQPCTDWSQQSLDGVAPLPDSPFSPLLDQVWWRVAQKHHDPTLGCLDWNAARKTYGQRLKGVEDARLAYRIVGDMLEELEQSHFRLFPPHADEETQGPAAPPLRVRWVEGELVVVESDIEAAPMGSRILAISDLPIDALHERALTRFSVEEPGFPSEIARLAMSRLSCPHSGMTRTMTLELPSSEDCCAVPGAPQRVEVTCHVPEGERVTLGHLVDIPTRVRSRVLPGKIGYLAFNIWMLPMLERISDAVAQLQDAEVVAMILDLRGNPGGVGPMAIPVARLFLRESADLGSLQFRDFTQSIKVTGNPTAFAGPLVVLVDEGTASTSEIFALGMQEVGRAKIIAAKTSAGAALPSVIEQLPGGAILQYVVGTYRSPRATLIEGRGVEPDVRVSEQRADFATGRDPVLDAAIHHLRAERHEP